MSGRRELALISEAQEIAMGRQGAADVITTIGLVPDAGLQTWVSSIGRQLSAGTGDRFAAYRATLVRSLNSFERLTDPTALAARPMRMRIDRAPRAMTLHQFDKEMPSDVPFAELAMINGLEEAAHLRAGQSIKRVTGTPMSRLK